MRKIIKKKNLCKSVKSVGLNNQSEKICVICEICVTKTTGAHFWREPLASGQISVEIRE